MRTLLILSLIVLEFTSCKLKQTKPAEKIMEKFEAFKRIEKFLPDEKLFYPGIAEPELKPIFTEKINLAADDFIKVAQSENATDNKYQEAIKKGLARFQNIYAQIDTEDSERI